MKRVYYILMVLLATTALTGCSLADGEAPAEKTAGKTPVADSSNDKGASTVGGAEDVTNDGIDTTNNNSDEALSNVGDKIASKVKKATLNLYFPDSGNEALIKESREVEVVDGAIIKAAVTALMNGPADKKLRNAFPEGTKLLGVNLKDHVAILDFTKEFNQAAHMACVVLRGSIANTLTGIDGIEKIRILIDGSPQIAPSGLPYEDMGKIRLDDQGKPLPD